MFCSTVPDLKGTFFNNKVNICRIQYLRLEIKTEPAKLINRKVTCNC